MIKLIATDMDDTLLDSSRKVSSYSLDIINKVRSRGVKFTICTGRMYDSAKLCLHAGAYRSGNCL